MYGKQGSFRSSATMPGQAPAASSAAAQNGAGTGPGGTHGPLVALLVLVAVYVAWAYIAAHEKVRESVQPRNMAINLWNLLVIAFTVVVALSLLKIVFIKLTAWGFPGAKSILAVIHTA